MRLILLLITFGFAIPVHTQVIFNKTFGTQGYEINQCGYTDGQGTICLAAESGYVLIGSSSQTISEMRNAMLIRTDMNGDTLWTRIIGDSTYHDYGNSVNPVSDGGFILTIYGGSTGVLLVKINAIGDTMWTRKYGTSVYNVGYHAIETSDGGFVLLASTSSLMSFNWSTLIIKTDALGNLQWEKTISSTLYQDLYSFRIIELTNGNFAIAGNIAGANVPGSQNMLLMETDPLGNLLWANHYGGAGVDIAYDLVEIPGGLVAVGYTQSFGQGNDMDVFYIRTDANGNLTDAKTFGSNTYERGVAIIKTSDSGFAISGYTAVYDPDADGLLLKLDSAGNFQWAKSIGGYAEEYFLGLVESPDAGFAITGYTRTFGAGGYDMYFVKTNSSGNGACNVTDVILADTTRNVATQPVSAVVQSVSNSNSSSVTIRRGLLSSTLCTTVDIRDAEREQYLSIYPNPARDFIYVPGLPGAAPVILELKSMQGEIVYSATVNSSGRIELPDLANGIYIAEFYNSGIRAGSVKLVIAK